MRYSTRLPCTIVLEYSSSTLQLQSGPRSTIYGVLVTYSICGYWYMQNLLVLYVYGTLLYGKDWYNRVQELVVSPPSSFWE